ncbi:MAG TPA: hypothetical protein VH063_12600 [Gaiellaceae bacterium]|jgi:hypothetical protein|nr:hypothetical protein [Gaiellaceae bacterium]
MAATDTTTGDAYCERDSALEQAAAAIGPLRDPDGCVLECPDCTCRLLLERRGAEGAVREPPVPGIV